MTTERWEPDRSTKSNAWPMPSLGIAIGRGLLGRCPACGKSNIFNGFLTVVEVLFIVDKQLWPIWVMSAIFVPLTFALALGLIRPIKGGTVGLMLNLNMLKSDPTAI
jgi:uncharacterized protein (DUF983 family)